MRIYSNEYEKDVLEKAESLLFNGNGYLGVRGNLEEAYYDFFTTNRETYINGFYETKTIKYPEKFIGFTETGETMISVVDGQTTLIKIGDEAFRVDAGEIKDASRYLDMTNGQTVRELTWTSPKGHATKIKITRIVSFVKKNIFAMKYEFEKINHDLEIELTTHINYYPVKTIDKNDPRMSHDIQKISVTQADLDNKFIAFKAPNSGLSAKCFWSFNEATEKGSVEEDKIILTNTLKGDTFIKMFSYEFENQKHNGFDFSFEALASEQKAYLDDFWNTAKVEIKADVDIEESVNFGMYSLLQSLGINGNNSIAAKGLSGSGYEGHYFWDTEMYIFPSFLHFKPSLAKQILQYRINKIEKARENRKMVGYKMGILYPWRTISGVEVSPFFEAGMAQHHINADIAYAFIKYYESTKELDIFYNGGFEILLETARLFTEIGYVRGGKFHIDKVTGPDEYSVLVNDNYYTNVMVKNQFKWVHKLFNLLKENDATQFEALCKKLNVTEAEVNEMLGFSEIMEKPICEEKKVIKQDRDFLNKEKWPFWEEGKFPLLLHYHPLVIYRYQVSKQADAVMALMLFPEEETKEIVKNSVEYYDEVTTHDSSLSYSAFSIVHNRVGNVEKSYQYFLENARCDLDNLHGNTKDGLHMASIGGTTMNILYGFCDLRFNENGDGFTLNPHLPKEIQSIKFSIVYKGDVYRISVAGDNNYQVDKL